MAPALRSTPGSARRKRRTMKGEGSTASNDAERATDRWLTLGYTVDHLVDMGTRGTIDAPMMADLRGA